MLGRRFDRSHELGQEAFGPKLGLWILVPVQLVVEVGADIVCMVTAGKSMKHAYSITCGHHCPLQDNIIFRIFLFALVQLVRARLPNFNSIAGISRISHHVHQAVIIFGVVLMFLSAIGGFRSLMVVPVFIKHDQLFLSLALSITCALKLILPCVFTFSEVQNLSLMNVGPYAVLLSQIATEFLKDFSIACEIGTQDSSQFFR